MAVIALLLICAVTVIGVQCKEGIAKRHVLRRDRLAHRFTEQEHLLSSIEDSVVLKFAELKAEHRTLGDKITASRDSTVAEMFAELKADHRILTNKAIDSDRKLETLQSEMSQLLASVNEIKDMLTRGVCRRIRPTDEPSRPTKPTTTTSTARPTTTTTTGPTAPRPCPVPGYVSNAYGCYKVVLESAFPDRASQRCHSDGAHLVSLESDGELRALAELMEANGWTPRYSSYYWTDGKRVDGQWRWMNADAPFNYTNWQYNQPTGDGDCVAMYYETTNPSHLQWANKRCSRGYPYYICEV